MSSCLSTLILLLRFCLFIIDFNLSLLPSLPLINIGTGMASRPINLATTPGLHHTTLSPAKVGGKDHLEELKSQQFDDDLLPGFSIPFRFLNEDRYIASFPSREKRGYWFNAFLADLKMSELFTHDILPRNIPTLHSFSFDFLAISSSNSNCNNISSNVVLCPDDLALAVTNGQTMLEKSSWLALLLCCWLRVEVEPSSLQKLVLIPFFILAPREFLRRKKDRSFIGCLLCDSLFHDGGFDFNLLVAAINKGYLY